MKKIFSVLSLLLLICALGFGQTTVSSTTLSGAITSLTATRFNVASATGITGFSNGQPTTYLYVDRELMQVVSITGTSVVVIRGVSPGSPAATHVTASKVWLGPYNAFDMGTDPAGSCTSSAQTYLPKIMVQTGNLFSCGNGQWTTFTAFVDRVTVGANIASATTIAPTNPVHHVTGTTAVVNITLPPACPATGCIITLIPDGLWSTTNAGNIAIATTGVVSKALVLTYDPGTSKWYPSY